VAFEPGVETTATEGRVFALDGQTLFVVDGAIPRGPRAEGDVVLGTLDGEACFGRFGQPVPGSSAVGLRQLFGVLDETTFAVALRALGFTAWDRDHRFCSRCGGPATASTKERARTCGACGYAAYPRLSPAVIVLIERDGRALLARNARTRSAFHSTLAGFVEVGESLEEAVRREIREEVGLELADIRYYGSQPWPFTSSLMIGFTARWASGELVMDETEVFDARWFAPDDLPVVPPRLSIARALIDDFVSRHLRRH